MPERDSNATCHGWRWLATAAAVAGLYWLWHHRRYLMGQTVVTGETQTPPEVLAQVFARSLAEVRAAIRKTIEGMPGWTLQAAEETTFLAQAPGVPFGGTASITIRLAPLMEGRLTRVDVRSEWRAKWPNLGANVRLVRKFQEHLRRLLPSGGEGDAD